MSKKFTKLMAAIALLTFLAVPMGMWGQTTVTYKLTIDANDFNSTSYAANNNEKTSNAVCITDNTNTYEVKWTSNQVMKSSDNMQWQKSNGYIYNSTNLGTITNVSVTSSAGTFTTYYGTTEQPSSSTTVGWGFFKTKVGSATGTTSKLEITFQIQTGGPTLESLTYTGTPTTTTYEAGDVFDPAGLSVYANYSDQSQEDVTADVVWTPNPLTQGTTSVTGTYSGQSVVINGITVTAPAEPNIVLDKNNKPYTSTSGSNTDVVTTTLDGIEYQSYAGYIYNNYLSFNRSQSGAYLGNNTQLCGNIKKIVVDYYQGGSSYFTMYEGTSALAETTTVSPSSTGTGKVTYTFSGNNGYFKFKLTTTGTYCNINSISIYLNDCSIYHVTYNANGATLGDVPSDPTEYDEGNNTVTVLGPGNLAKTGYGFSGWNTVADGSGTSYNEDDTFEITGNTTLYAQWTAYTITAQSNDTDYGTVYLDGFTITASPADGCRYASPAYSVSPDNSAEVTQSGNTFTVTPTANTTVTINFEEIPTHTATFSVNGTTNSTQVAEGAAITFPADPADIEGKTFMGWVENAINGTTNTPPPFVTSATMGNADVTYYAVFATADGSGPTTYEKLDSDSFDANAKYVIGAAQSSTDNTMWYYKGSIDNKWGRMTSNPETNAPVKFTLSGSASALVAKDDNGDYLKGLTSGSFEMSTSSTAIALTSSGTIRNSNSGSYYLRHNYNSGNGGLRWYSGNTGTLAYFYKVIPGVSYSAYCTTVAALTDPFITVAPASVEVPATAAEEIIEGTLAITYGNLEISDMSDFDVEFYDAQGNAIASGNKPTWIEVSIATEDPNVGEGYVVSYTVQNNTGAERMASFKVFALSDEDFVYSNLITISQAEYEAPSSWVLTDLADLTPADVFVIVGTRTDATYGGNYAMSNDKGTSSAPDAVAVVVVDETLSGEIPANIQWNISGNATDGYTFYPVGEAETWLYCTNSNNGVRVGTNSNKTFKVENGYLKNSANSRFVGVYNAQDWRCYDNTDGNIKDQTFAFYKKVSENVVSYTKEITGHGGNNDGGWNLIASPVASVTPSSNNGFIASTNEKYDLYYFDQTAAKEWKNYKANSFNLVSGQGYLYANENTVTLTFEGQPYNGNGIVSLTYSTVNEDENMRGWNLIGNPFSTAATLNLPFFKMNGTGSGFTSQNANSSVAAMEGVLVYAYDDDASQPISTATFTAAGRSNSESAAMVNIDVVSSFGDVMDNAIVNFNEGIQLPKFYFGTQNANIYIPRGNKEYAVVSTEAQGEMPVNFKAAENGTYTLTVNPEGVEMNYLHLIDNMTGADIDLLAATSTGSVATYTFNASTTDYSSRFRLVFAANNEDGVSTGSTAFAFYSNGTWVINNTGEATLQVVDVNGRILSSETVNGSVSKAINAPAGVYMLRLINGNDVKTQKIVVR